MRIVSCCNVLVMCALQVKDKKHAKFKSKKHKGSSSSETSDDDDSPKKRRRADSSSSDSITVRKHHKVRSEPSSYQLCGNMKSPPTFL